jgi:hypothetical protein
LFETSVYSDHIAILRFRTDEYKIIFIGPLQIVMRLLLSVDSMEICDKFKKATTTTTTNNKIKKKYKKNHQIWKNTRLLKSYPPQKIYACILWR